MKHTSLQSLPVLPIKPGEADHQKLYGYYETELNGEVSFRSLKLHTDMEMIYNWVNQVYAREFWQLDGSIEVIRNIYRSILENPRAHSFIGCINEIPVCQIDLYGVSGEELQEHVVAPTDFDSGMHLLMSPPSERQKGISGYMLKNFQRWYFSFTEHQRLFAEPDQEHILANKLLMDAGFHFVKTIQLSNKTANLYCLTKGQFSK